MTARRQARRTCTPAEAAALVRPRDSIAIPLGPGQPAAFLNALGDRGSFEELKIVSSILTGLYRVLACPGVTLLSGFHGPVERGLRAGGHDVRFVPGDFRRFGPLIRRFRPRIVSTLATPPDENGMCSLALHAGGIVPELWRASRDPDRILLVETSPHLPRTLGLPPEHPHAIPIEAIDVLVESEFAPGALPESEPSDVERAIAVHARGYIPDGATLQTGIGGIPSEVAKLLADGPGGDYGVHSEMFTNGLMALHQKGKVTNQKGQFDGFSVCTFAYGTPDLYRWLDGNPDVRFLPVEIVNDPMVIARNRSMISLNGALAVDIAGQIAADSINGRQWSGVGGHEDFVNGAALSEGGHSLICMPSTATIAGRAVSRIEARFPAGALVTTPRHQVDVVITEHGAAELAGKTYEERAEALIAIAHPDFRDVLAAEAEEVLKLRSS